MTDKKYIPTQYNAPNLLSSIDKFIGKFQWIRVEDQLPEKDKEVLIFLDNEIYSAFFIKENTTFIVTLPNCLDKDNCYNVTFLFPFQIERTCNCCNIIESKKVTHWMELPEPPRENDE